MHTIKNLTLNVGEQSNFGLINILKNRMENIKFENINIKGQNNIDINNIGIIANNIGDIKNVEFSNINIDLPLEKTSYVGCIGTSTGLEISNVTIQNINIVGKSGVGGLLGYAEYYKVNDIVAKEVHINGIENVAGIIVRAQPVN